MINYIPRRFTVIRDKELCINCGCCVRQCSNECHFFDEEVGSQPCRSVGQGVATPICLPKTAWASDLRMLCSSVFK